MSAKKYWQFIVKTTFKCNSAIPNFLLNPSFWTYICNIYILKLCRSKIWKKFSTLNSWDNWNVCRGSTEWSARSERGGEGPCSPSPSYGPGYINNYCIHKLHIKISNRLRVMANLVILIFAFPFFSKKMRKTENHKKKLHFIGSPVSS